MYGLKYQTISRFSVFQVAQHRIVDPKSCNIYGLSAYSIYVICFSLHYSQFQEIETGLLSLIHFDALLLALYVYI
jgi:hypothetical protein